MTPARHALTVLTRLASRRPQERDKLLRALEGRLEALGPIALEVATETGDPIGQVLADALMRSRNKELAANLVKLLPRDTTALREAAVAITDLARAAANGAA